MSICVLCGEYVTADSFHNCLVKRGGGMKIQEFVEQSGRSSIRFLTDVEEAQFWLTKFAELVMERAPLHSSHVGSPNFELGAAFCEVAAKFGIVQEVR